MREHVVELEVTDRELYSITLSGVIAKAITAAKHRRLTTVETTLLVMAIAEYEKNLKAAETLTLKVQRVATLQLIGGRLT